MSREYDQASVLRKVRWRRVDGLCPLDEQIHCRNVCERTVIWETLGVWERQGQDGELVFATQAQHLAAGDQELESRARF